MRITSTALFLIVFISIYSKNTSAQSYNLQLEIINQPNNPVILEWVSGDSYTKIDSSLVNNGTLSFQFPADTHVGVYRLNFGKTGYARVMNTDPQTLDFIFNRENIHFKTDFKNPFVTAEVVYSKENEVYFDFLKRLKEYQGLLEIIEKELDSYWQQSDTAKAIDAANEFNRLQMEWDLRVVQTVQQNNDLFASKLIAIKRVPLKDGFLTPEERIKNYRKNFLQDVDFSDESLIYSTALSDKIFNFLVLFNQPGFTREQRVANYFGAVDEILSRTRENEQVHNFIVDYLIHGFEVLDMKEIIRHIIEKD